MKVEQKYSDILQEKLTSYPYKKEYEHSVNKLKIDVPMIYGDASSVMCFFPVSLSKIKTYLSDPRIKPIPIYKDMTFLVINVFEYRKSQAGPFNEFTFSVPVMFDVKFTLPIIPLLFDQSFEKFGMYVIQLGASNDLGREHIKEIWGYPTYKKNLDISINNDKGRIISTIKDNGKNILTMSESLPKKYKLSFTQKKFHTYFEKEKKLGHVELNTLLFEKMLFGQRDFSLELGDHELSDILKKLEVKKKSITVLYQNAIEIAGKVVII